jgi:DNA-binding NarL/FixJ family response regulator
MDIRMPGMNGIAATRSLVESGARCRVCMLTTYGLDENVYDALEVGAAGFLVKTDPPEHIVTAVQALAAGDTILGPETTRVLVRRFLTGSRPGEAAADLPASALTSREAQVLNRLAGGLNNAEIAERLFIGEGTVKTHVGRILTKLAVRDRVQAAVLRPPPPPHRSTPLTWLITSGLDMAFGAGRWLSRDPTDDRVNVGARKPPVVRDARSSRPLCGARRWPTPVRSTP